MVDRRQDILKSCLVSIRPRSSTQNTTDFSGALSDSNTGYLPLGNDNSRNRGLIIGDGCEMSGTARPNTGGRNGVYFDGDIGMIMFWEATLTDDAIVATYDLTKKFYQVRPSSYVWSAGCQMGRCRMTYPLRLPSHSS